ncbi:MAG: serine O-acetyltransferase EpsC [Bacteroidota bacterium]
MPALNNIPSRKLLNEFTENLYEALLPIIAADDNRCLEAFVIKKMEAELEGYLTTVLQDSQKATETGNALFAKMDAICTNLRQDAELILHFDPAAYSLEEVIVTYPGFRAITIHRVAHELYKMHVPIIPRMMSEWAHSSTGIDINPGAIIGQPFFIDHGTGVVIGETSVIGNNVKLYQGVTLGALNVRKEDAKNKRHPTIEDNVVIYANSTILGGETIIGHDSVIGGNTWITESILPYSVVYHQQEQVVGERKEVREVLNWVI